MSEDEIRRTALQPFRKASFSEAMGHCVEVAKVEAVAVRNSRDPEGPVLYFTMDEWVAFILGVKNNEFDID